MSIITTVIPSKNRAAQLDLLIRSLNVNFCDTNIIVLYKVDNQKHQDGYDILINKYPNVIFIKENDDPIRLQILKIINNINKGYINFCTDDTVFYRAINLNTTELLNLISDDVCAFIPRLGLNTIVQNYTSGEMQRVLIDYETVYNNILKYNWINGNILHNYYYPSTQDGCVISIDFFKDIANFNWINLRSLEGTLAIDRRKTMYGKPNLLIPSLSLCVNIPINAVQGGLYCSDKVYQSVNEMNEKFLSGKVLSLDKSDFSNIIGCHQEIDLKWE